MKYLIFIFLFFSYSLYSQGFEWYSEPRMPIDNSQLYVGADLSYSNDYHNGSFDMREFEITCCSFSLGSGNSIYVGVAGEYWTKNYFAISGSLLYRNLNSKFTSSESLPMVNGVFVREFIYEGNVEYFSFKAGARYKFYPTQFSVGASFTFSSLFDVENTYSDRKVSPAEHPYQGGVFSDRVINDLNRFNAIPEFIVAYDFNLGYERYANVYFSVSSPVFSVIKNDEWSYYSIALGIKVLAGIK